MSIETIVKEFQQVAANPSAQLKKYKAEGKKVIGVLPYYAPEELVYAAGMVPMGIWAATTRPSPAPRSTAPPSTAPSPSWLWRCCWTAPWTAWTA